MVTLPISDRTCGGDGGLCFESSGRWDEEASHHEIPAGLLAYCSECSTFADLLDVSAWALSIHDVPRYGVFGTLEQGHGLFQAM